MTEPDRCRPADHSAAEEQPQQDDHRYRHAHEPEQKSFSHFRLHEFCYGFKNATSNVKFQQAEQKKRNMPRYKLAIFDLDGTLSDSFPWFLRVVNSIADRHGFRRVEPGDVEMLRGKSSREIIRHLQVPMWRMPLIAADMRRLKSRSIDSIPLFAGVEPMLQELSQRGVLLAMVSSDSERNVRKALGNSAALMSRFACGASMFGKAAKYRTVLKRTGMAAEDAISIGDEVRDGEAARQAGIDFGAVGWGFGTPEALRQVSPALVFERVADIARLI